MTEKTAQKNSLKQNLLFAGFILFIVVLLSSISGERSNRIPEDEFHKVLTTDAACLECHGPEGIKPRGAKHPPKDQCQTCHKTKRNRKQ